MNFSYMDRERVVQSFLKGHNINFLSAFKLGFLIKFFGIKNMKDLSL